MSEEGVDRLRRIQETGAGKDRERQEHEHVLEEPEGVPGGPTEGDLGDYVPPREGGDEG